MSNRNQQGQSIGRKGADTRQRLLQTARALLLRDETAKLTAVAISRAAGTSSATFYLYFKDVDDVLLSLAEEAADDTGDILEALAQPWPDTQLAANSRRFVDAFYRYWGRHREVLAVRNFQSDLGNEAFNEVRRRTAMPIIQRISELIHKASGDISPTDALARSVVIYAAMERLAARRQTELEREELGSEALLRAEADILVLLFRSQG